VVERILQLRQVMSAWMIACFGREVFGKPDLLTLFIYFGNKTLERYKRRKAHQRLQLDSIELEYVKAIA